jgi:peptidoglycan/LPS O-acetylase OafA/YrhL
MRREIKSLTTLRAIAAGLVFFYHFVYLRNPVPASNVIEVVTQNGFIGVNIMFVLSGFVLTLRYYCDVEEQRLQWKDYIKRRVIRLYPSYFFLLAAIALLGAPINVSNVTITQGFFTQYFQTGIINSWSLTAEECFYLLLPILLWPLVRYKRLTVNAIMLGAWAMGLLLLGLSLVRWSNASGIATQAGFLADDVFMLTRTFFGYGVEFAVGMFAALLYRQRGAFGVTTSSIMAAASIAGVTLCLYLMTLYPDPIPLRTLRYIVAVLSSILVFALTCETLVLSRLLSLRPFVYLGRLSYGLYLVQLTPVVWFMTDWPVWSFYIGCNLVSALLYHLIEKPARELFLRRPTPAPATIPSPATAGRPKSARDYAFVQRTN